MAPLVLEGLYFLFDISLLAPMWCYKEKFMKIYNTWADILPYLVHGVCDLNPKMMD